ncbi:hypothetical protein FM119_07520 [Mycetocola reblochoni REB411]|uniref:Uncharacterized protein n=1 Tax=Mycetocola reblochoni REB411 TaxID=1255698 RepID=A0A1R4JH86_9MICO|nr:hypothetical protein FM119_07520 [Mycetocola reblochoni REB411]
MGVPAPVVTVGAAPVATAPADAAAGPVAMVLVGRSPRRVRALLRPPAADGHGSVAGSPRGVDTAA